MWFRIRGSPRRVLQLRRIDLFVETDEQRLSAANRRCAKVAGGAEHMCQQRVVIGAILLQGEARNLLPLGYDQLRCACGQLQGLLRPEPGLGVDGLLGRDPVSCKVPLRLRARRSPFSVIVPVNPLGHTFDSSKQEHAPGRATRRPAESARMFKSTSPLERPRPKRRHHTSTLRMYLQVFTLSEIEAMI